MFDVFPDFSSCECGDVWNFYHIIDVWTFSWTFFYSFGAQEINIAPGMDSDLHYSCYSLRSYQFIPYVTSYGQPFSRCTELPYTNIFAVFTFGMYGTSIVLVGNLFWMKLYSIAQTARRYVSPAQIKQRAEISLHFFSFRLRCDPNALDLSPVRVYTPRIESPFASLLLTFLTAFCLWRVRL